MECKRLKNRAVTKRLQRRIKYDVACKISNEKSEDVLDDWINLLTLFNILDCN
jgi:hypothetical protein